MEQAWNDKLWKLGFADMAACLLSIASLASKSLHSHQGMIDDS